ncbi:MAG: nucleotide exchange factor GrpE [Planctomycetota bacterium]
MAARQEEHEQHDQPEAIRPTHPEGAHEEGLSEQYVEELVALARAGELEVPAGADDLAAALIAVADARDSHLEKLQYTAADFHNFRRRAQNNEIEAKRQGITGVVQSILSVMDNFDLALQQDSEKVSVEQIQSGVEVIKNDLLRVLSGFGVVVIEAAPGEEFDPGRHEAVMQQPAGEVAAGGVIQTLQAGYALGERVIRPAKVIVAAGEG